MTTKPLGGKAYTSIGHLPGSRVGPGDHHVNEGQARICTEKARDQHDTIIVQEKLDGSCTAVALLDGQILALTRSGHLAQSSKFELHQLFAAWVREREDRFKTLLLEGQRAVGEWLALAHGTRYALPHEPWVLFDILVGPDRLPYSMLTYSNTRARFPTAHVISHVEGAESAFALGRVKAHFEVHGSAHGALDGAEGAVWRVERNGRVDFLAKWVRPDKVDGCYMPEFNPKIDAPVWNWRPSDEPRKGS